MNKTMMTNGICTVSENLPTEHLLTTKGEKKTTVQWRNQAGTTLTRWLKFISRIIWLYPFYALSRVQKHFYGFLAKNASSQSNSEKTSDKPKLKNVLQNYHQLPSKVSRKVSWKNVTLSQFGGNERHIITKCNVGSWIRSWTRKSTWVETLVKSK